MILKGSTSAKAGLKVGDEVVRINDKPVNRIPIEEILELIRHSENSVKIAYKPRAVIARVRDVLLKKRDGRVGIRLQRRSDGLFIDVVVQDSAAIKAGLKEGDELLRINDRVVIDWSQERATRYLKELPNNSDVVLYIREMLPMAHVSGSRLSYPGAPATSVSPARLYCASPALSVGCTGPGGRGMSPISEPGSPTFAGNRSTCLSSTSNVLWATASPCMSRKTARPLNGWKKFLRDYPIEIGPLPTIADNDNELIQDSNFEFL